MTNWLPGRFTLIPLALELKQYNQWVQASRTTTKEQNWTEQRPPRRDVAISRQLQHSGTVEFWSHLLIQCVLKSSLILWAVHRMNGPMEGGWRERWRDERGMREGIVQRCSGLIRWTLVNPCWISCGFCDLAVTNQATNRSSERITHIRLQYLSFRCLCLLLILLELYIAASSSDTGIRGPSNFMISRRMCAHVCVLHEPCLLQIPY